MPPLPPQFQLATPPGGTWRVRVFNLPPHREGVAPTLPFLRALAAQPGLGRGGWYEDPEKKLTVLRLAGVEQASLAALLALLEGHGISRATALGPVSPRRARPAS